MGLVLDDWIRQGKNLKNACEHIRGKQIKLCTWFSWEKLVGSVGRQGQKIAKRNYSDEQARIFLTIAYIRNKFPRCSLTYENVRCYYLQYDHLIEEVYDRFVNGERDEVSQSTQTPLLVSLHQVKACCDQVCNRRLSRYCWRKWKKNLGIPLRAKEVEEGLASMLVFTACWRENNPQLPLPSQSRLNFLMSQAIQPNSINSVSTHAQQNKWQLQGCLGKDLPKFLAFKGYRVNMRSLYNWNPDFKKKKHYSVSELNDWLAIAYSKRYKGKNHGYTSKV